MGGRNNLRSVHGRGNHSGCGTAARSLLYWGGEGPGRIQSGEGEDRIGGLRAGGPGFEEGICLFAQSVVE